MKKYDISIVIPVYKSSDSLFVLVDQIKNLQVSIGYTVQLVFVNDSPFFLKTCESLDQISKNYENIKVITLRKNRGQHMALLVGLSKAEGEYIFTMDDDLQHPVEDIPKLLTIIKENKDIDVIFAIPDKTKKHSFWRNLGSKLINNMISYFQKKPKGLVGSSFRLMTNEVSQVIVNNYNAMPSVSSLLIQSTDNIINVKVGHNKREFGVGNYSFSQLLTLSLNNIIHYSSLPLKIVGFVGFIGFASSIIFVLVIIVKKLFFDLNFPGYASTVSLISFFGGLNLLAIGIIGEYLIRIIKEQQKPSLEDLIK